MRILLDEDIPRPVRRLLAGHDVRTAQQMGWAGYANGRVLQAAERAGFEVPTTGDRNFVLQQNLTGRTIAVVVLSTNIWPAIRAQPHRVQSGVANAAPGTFSVVHFPHRRRPLRDLQP
jgi:hypothetical protein